MMPPCFFPKFIIIIKRVKLTKQRWIQQKNMCFFFSSFHSNHNAVFSPRPRQKMQRHREGLLCEWRWLLLLPRYKPALLQVSNFLFFVLHNYIFNFSFSVFHDVVFTHLWSPTMHLFHSAVYFPDSPWFPFSSSSSSTSPEKVCQSA